MDCKGQSFIMIFILLFKIYFYQRSKAEVNNKKRCTITEKINAGRIHAMTHFSAVCNAYALTNGKTEISAFKSPITGASSYNDNCQKIHCVKTKCYGIWLNWFLLCFSQLEEMLKHLCSSTTYLFCYFIQTTRPFIFFSLLTFLTLVFMHLETEIK